jgi:hypothetical protein
VPAGLHSKLLKWSRLWLTTKINEEGVHEVKTRASGSALGKMCRARRMSALVQSSLLQDFGMQPVRTSQKDRVQAAGVKLVEEQFDASHAETSLPEAHFDSITTEAHKDKFPQMRAQDFHSNGLAWRAYMQAGSFASLQEVWPSMFVPVGVHLLESYKEDGVAKKALKGITLHACEHYVLVLPVGVASPAGRLAGWSSTSGAEPYSLVQIRDLGKYSVVEIKTVPPAETFLSDRAAGKFALGVRSVSGFLSIGLVQARRAFKGITVKWLARFHTHLKLVGPRPTLERELVRVLILHFLPDLTDKPRELEELLLFRCKPAEAELIPCALSPEEIQKNSNDFVDSRDLDDLHKVAKQVSNFRKSQGIPGPQPQTQPPSAAASSSDGAQHASGPRPITKQAPVWPESEEFSLLEARKLFPRDGTCIVSRDDSRHYRWVCVYAGGSQSAFTKAWNDEISPKQALKIVLEKVWGEHARLGRDICHFALDDICA